MAGGLDAFFRAVPANEDAQFQTMARIPRMLGAVEETDDIYRQARQRRELQQRSQTIDPNQQLAGLAPVGFAMPPSVFDVTNKPMPGNRLDTYIVPRQEPVPVPSVPTARIDVPGTITETDVVPSVPARVDTQTQQQQQRPTTATQVLQQWEAANGPMPEAVRNKVYQNAQGKGASLTVPDYTPGGKSRVGEVDAGIPGYEVIDPNVAGWSRNAAMVRNQSAINTYRDNIRNKLATGDYGLAGNVFGSIKGYFTDTTQEAAKRTAIQGALDWFNSKEAIEYFNQNPNALPLANLDPVGFVDSFKKEANVRASRRGEVVSEALTVPPVNLRDGKTSKIDPKFIANSTSVTDKRIVDLTNTMDAALQRPQTQQIITLAGQLQVDPAAALAVYGLETNYGATSAESGKGASGPMQVMPETFKNIKKWFTNPDIIKKYNLPEGTVSAARAMEFNTVNGKITGGLLVLKYNELIGNPKNLWGAGYQGNADAVLQQKRPLNAHDGNIMNADYNRAYVSLYNEALTRLGGGQPVVQAQVQAAAPTKTIVIGDSVAEGFAKANKLEGSYKTGESPKAVYERLQAYVAKNDIKGAVVYVGTGLPNNPQQQDFVAKQIALIKEKGGTPYIIGVGPGTQQNPTTGQNEYLAKLAAQNQVQFTGPLADMFPDITKDKMGLHLNDAQSKQLYATTTKKVQVDNTGRTVNRVVDVTQNQQQQQNQQQPAAVEQPAAGVQQPAISEEPEEHLKRIRVALSMKPEEHNFTTNKYLNQRQNAVAQYQQTRQSITNYYTGELNTFAAQRKQLAMEAEVARSNGLIKEMQTKLDQIRTLDQNINKTRFQYESDVMKTDQTIQQGLEGIDNNLGMAISYQALSDFQYGNNPQRLERIWSWYSGQEVRIQPRSDGRFNLYLPVNGQLQAVAVYDKSKMADVAMRSINETYNQQKLAAEAALSSKVMDTNLETAKLVKVELVKGINSLQLEGVKSQTELAKKSMELQGFENVQKVINPNGGETVIGFSKDGNYIAQIDLNPAKLGTDGKYPAEAVTVLPTGMNRGLNINRR